MDHEDKLGGDADRDKPGDKVIIKTKEILADSILRLEGVKHEISELDSNSKTYIENVKRAMQWMFHSAPRFCGVIPVEQLFKAMLDVNEKWNLTLLDVNEKWNLTLLDAFEAYLPPLEHLNYLSRQ